MLPSVVSEDTEVCTNIFVLFFLGELVNVNFSPQFSSVKSATPDVTSTPSLPSVSMDADYCNKRILKFLSSVKRGKFLV